MQQDSKMILKQGNFIEITLWHGCSPVNLLHTLRTSSSKNTSGRLLLKCSFSSVLLIPIRTQSLLQLWEMKKSCFYSPDKVLVAISGFISADSFPYISKTINYFRLFWTDLEDYLQAKYHQYYFYIYIYIYIYIIYILYCIYVIYIYIYIYIYILYWGLVTTSFLLFTLPQKAFSYVKPLNFEKASSENCFEKSTY